MKFFFKPILKVSAFYLEKQKSLIPKINIETKNFIYYILDIFPKFNKRVGLNNCVGSRNTFLDEFGDRFLHCVQFS